MTIHCETRACIAFITIDRPARRTAMAAAPGFAGGRGRGRRFSLPAA
ncbi:hypothetical protein L2D01_06070 [Hyphomonadaceae bacterium ML37]|nr:hypothetical protein L2D01_06070 [Hyphomonadaceae bacterium ML37]